jgi:hypothetical protein
LVMPSCLFLDGVSCIPRCILHIARGFVGGPLGFIDLALGFQVLVTSELTGTFFHGAFGLIGSTLHMFAIHDRVPLRSGIRDNEGITQSFPEAAPFLRPTTSEFGTFETCPPFQRMSVHAGYAGSRRGPANRANDPTRTSEVAIAIAPRPLVVR